MSKGQYVVYERASKDEARLFIDTARETVGEMKEPEDWKRHNPRRHAGGRPLTYTFRQMFLILLLMVYQRKEYREMEAHLSNDPHLLKELGLRKAPGKSTMQRACARIGTSALVRMNDAVIAKFKKREAV